MSFDVLKRILYTCRRASLDEIAVGVMRSGDPWQAGCETVPLELPYDVRAAREQWPPELRVRILVQLGDETVLKAGHERMTIAKKNSRYDHASLRTVLTRVRTYVPHKKDLQVAVADKVQLGDVIDTLQTVYATGFTTISLVDAEGVLAKPLEPAQVPAM